jgi:AAA+ superfamily predicted ATPase
MASSGMSRRVTRVRTDVSEELSACIIRVTRIDELRTTLAVTSNRRWLRRNAKVRKEVSMEFRLRLQRGVGVAGGDVGL